MDSPTSLDRLPNGANQTGNPHREDVSLLVAEYSAKVLPHEGNQNGDQLASDGNMGKVPAGITEASAGEEEAERFKVVTHKWVKKVCKI